MTRLGGEHLPRTSKTTGIVITTSGLTAVGPEFLRGVGLGPGDVPGRGKVAVTIVNSGAGALTAFDLEIKSHPDAPWTTLYTDTDWATATDAVPFVSTVVPNTLASGATAVFHFVPSAYAWRMRATSASSSTLAVYVSAD